jgi:hypothetical protein
MFPPLSTSVTPKINVMSLSSLSAMFKNIICNMKRCPNQLQFSDLEEE